jgi:hypothetical protein
MCRIARFLTLKYGKNVMSQWPWASAQLIICMPTKNVIKSAQVTYAVEMFYV